MFCPIPLTQGCQETFYKEVGMTLRINHNTDAINAHRSLQNNDHQLGKSLEKLSSGLKINRGADGPATLVISEQMRAQLAGLNQAVRNSETAISMVQTTEGALNTVNSMLISMRQLAIHAGNEGVNDQVMLQADQQEISNTLASLDRISKQTQFGNRRLLDGSNGANGAVTGKALEFVRASIKTNDSAGSGFQVNITQNATRANLEGSVALTNEMVKAGETFTVIEGGRSVTYEAKAEDNVQTSVQNLQNAIEQAGLRVTVSLNEGNTLNVIHSDYGSKHEFQVSSSTAGVLSQVSGAIESSQRGFDVAGTINGEAAKGAGRLLSGVTGTKNVDGLVVRYSGDLSEGIANDTGTDVGSVFVAQNSLTFQVGANQGQTVGISLLNTSGTQLARGIINKSNFEKLSDINVMTAQSAQDSLTLIDAAVDEVTKIRADLGAFQKNTLEGGLSNLRIAEENLTAAESVIRDVDMAAEMAIFTRNQIMTESATAMLAQANQSPKSILQLLG